MYECLFMRPSYQSRLGTHGLKSVFGLGKPSRNKCRQELVEHGRSDRHLLARDHLGLKVQFSQEGTVTTMCRRSLDRQEVAILIQPFLQIVRAAREVCSDTSTNTAVLEF